MPANPRNIVQLLPSGATASAAKARLNRVINSPGAMRTPSYSAEVAELVGGKPDYARRAMMALALTRLDAEGVPGQVAEVGVYRGDTSVLLQALSGTRRLMLFDTFEGFPEDHLEESGRGDERFRDTDVEAVRRRVPQPNVDFHVGLVPDTLEAVAGEQFAFVSLDLDLHTPTLASLEFFHPRMPRGAYLFVHDYNNPESEWACKRAVDTFFADKPELPVEIGDIHGSVVVRKAG